MFEYPINQNQLKVLLSTKEESENLEFKVAKVKFNRKSLFDYVAALSNEGGGKLILGVNNNREVVGTKAYLGTENKLPHDILQATNLKIYLQTLMYENKRVVIIFIPQRPVGRPIASNGNYRYPMRVGESLVEMDVHNLQLIFSETEPDYSAKTIPSLGIFALDEHALEKFRVLWSKKSNRTDYLTMPFEKMLQNLDLLYEEEITSTALILLGKTEILDRYLPDSEIIFEWRQDSNKTNYSFRHSWRGPFIIIYDDIWKSLNARNIKYSFQEGFLQRDLRAFDEKPFREALLNAVAHRDYNLKGQSIFVKASAESCMIESPGGLISGITLDNILYRTAWRNRKLAEVLEKAGLVERSGQGLDDIYEISIRSGKGTPKVEEIAASSFRVTLPAIIQDENFVKFLESFLKEGDFSFEEIIELERIRKAGKVDRVRFEEKFLLHGLIEKVGRGRARKYMLSYKYYKNSNQTGVYTRLTGISREKYKELILKHIEKNGQGKAIEFRKAFPELSPTDISNFLRELKDDQKIIFVGKSGPAGIWKLHDFYI